MKIWKNYLIYLFIIGFFGFTGCGKSQSEQADHGLNPEEVKNLIQSDQEVILIDVRTPGEYTGELGHIEGTVLRPVQEIEKWAGEFENNKDKKIVMICRSGNRSGFATKYFLNKGFHDVYNMEGGMRAWNRLKYPVTREPAGEEGSVE